MPDSAGNRECWQRYDLTVNRYGGQGGGGYMDGNNYDDPALEAAWLFNTASWYADSAKTNTLGQPFGVVATNDSTIYVESDASLQSITGPSHDSASFIGLNQTGLTSTFPGKFGVTENDFTATFWFKAIYIDQFEAGSASRMRLGFDTRSWEISPVDYLDPGPSGSWDLQLYVTTGQYIILPANMPSEKWYHIAVTFEKNGTDTDYRVRIWSPDTQTVIYTGSGTLTGLITGTASQYFGIQTTYSLIANQSDTTMWLDEFLIWRDGLTDTQIDEVRQGIYTYP